MTTRVAEDSGTPPVIEILNPNLFAQLHALKTQMSDAQWDKALLDFLYGPPCLRRTDPRLFQFPAQCTVALILNQFFYPSLCAEKVDKSQRLMHSLIVD